MTTVSTLSDLFEHAQLPYRIYHLGRRVVPCSRVHFRAFEEEKVAWETPFRSEARIALVIDDPKGNAALSRVWCLALPLDEQGKLQPATRDAFLGRLLDAGLEASLNSEQDSRLDPMKDNPIAHAPSMMARAMLHAWLARDSDFPLSDDARRVADYMLAPDGDTVWSALSLQGMADWCVRLDNEQCDRLAETLTLLTDDVIGAACQCLEHVPHAHEPLAHALQERTCRHPALKTLGIRAVMSTRTDTAVHWLDELLANAPDIETLAAISLRGWQHLEHAERLPLFLNALASNPQVNLRDTLHDLALIPRLRLPVIMTLQQAGSESPLGKKLVALGLTS